MSNNNQVETFAQNILKATDVYQQVVTELLSHQKTDDTTMQTLVGPIGTSSAFSEMAVQWLSDPDKWVKRQLDYYDNYTSLLENTTQRLMGEQNPPLYQPEKRDHRFKDKAWDESAIFDFIKQSYLLTAEWLQETVKATEGVDKKTALRLDFYTRQLIDALSPTNFLYTNPEALKETIQSNGANLIRGLENFLYDIKRSGNGPITVQTSNQDAFAVGKNLATTPGKVIYQNDLMQLIQYDPIQPNQYSRPVLIIPAWINKYYILDLQEKNSFVQWLLEQGYSVFMISWVNPDKNLSNKNMENYMAEGPIAALDAIESITGAKEITAIGYCLGGTLLATTLAYLKAKKDDRIKAATFLTTMVDFSECGDLSVFIDEEHIEGFESRMSENGYLEGKDMSITFNMLRANDMIWSFVVNNYLLGKDPFPFDILYWNSDTTRLPTAMHSYYLRNMYYQNRLVQPNVLTMKDTPIDLSQIDIPCYFLSTKEDHIAPWKTTYAAMHIFKGPIRFVLSASGHVAGVVNHPNKKKYCYWVNEKKEATPDIWLEGTKEHAGSWWLDWNRWNAPLSGKKIKTDILKKKGSRKAIEDAPGSYVLMRCTETV